MELKREINNTNELENLLSNIAWCYIGKNDYKRATEYIDSAFTTCSTYCSDNFLMDAFLGLGYIAQGRDELFDAEKFFIESYNISK